VGSVVDFAKLFLADPSAFYLLARLLFGVGVGTFTIWILYKMAAKGFSTGHGLLSAFFLSIAFLHVRDAHFIYADMFLLLILVASFIPIQAILRGGGERCYFIFAVLFGTAVATKYNGVFVLVPFLVAHVLREGVRWQTFFQRKLVWTGLFAIGTYSLLNPFTWLDSGFFFGELFQQSESTGFTGPWHHLVYSLRGGMGTPLLCLSLLGLIWNVFRPSRERWPMISFVLIYYVVLCLFSQHYDRYVLPLIPFLVFFAADALLRLAATFRISISLVVVLAVIFSGSSLARAYFPIAEDWDGVEA